MEQAMKKIEDETASPENTGTAEIIDFAQKKKEKEEGEFLKKVEQERREAKERFGSLIDSVSERYGNLPEAMREDFVLHNGEILDGAIELGMKKGFSKEELEKLELSAIFHDMTKADAVPEEFKDVPNYTLAMHAKSAAEKVPEFLTDEKLKELNIEGDPEAIRQEVSRAILEHMGPIPGFMSGLLEGFNKKMESKGEKGVDYPEAKGKISEALLAADMKSLAGEKGRKKILSIRANVEFFKQQDLALAEEYKKFGIDLSQGEAALISGFASADQARDMQKDQENWKWINDSIEKSKQVAYAFPNSEKPMQWEEVYAKMKHYEEAKEIAEVKKKLAVA